MLAKIATVDHMSELPRGTGGNPGHVVFYLHSSQGGQPAYQRLQLSVQLGKTRGHPCIQAGWGRALPCSSAVGSLSSYDDGRDAIASLLWETTAPSVLFWIRLRAPVHAAFAVTVSVMWEGHDGAGFSNLFVLQAI